MLYRKLVLLGVTLQFVNKNLYYFQLDIAYGTVCEYKPLLNPRKKN
jgi:hypothetical protein